jgi:phage terminase large subunit
MKQNPNYNFLWERIEAQRWLLLQGGTRSAKTFSTIHFLIAFCWTYKDLGVEIDIVRDTFTALKATVWKDFENVLMKEGYYSERNHNKTDHIYRLFGNNINYYGADNPEKIHGRSRDILWLNEGNQIDKRTIDQLTPRTRHRIICDYNPALGDEHWLDEYIEQFPPLITTYKDNPYLTAAQIADIESKKNNPYWWSVYGSGERAKREGVIFESYEIGEIPNYLPFVFGQDYGFSNDPTTLVKVAFDKSAKRIYIHECYYQQRLHTSEIIELNKQHAGNGLIIGDSAEPRLIAELKRSGLNIKGAEKKAILYGIKLLQDYTLVVSESSDNVIKELNSYAWHDKKSETPIDDYNHAIDAIRYAAIEYLSQPKRKSSIILS